MVRRVVSDEEPAGLGVGAVKRMDDEALVGRVLEGRGRLGHAIRGRCEVVLGMRKGMELCRAARKNERESEKKPEQSGARIHAGIIRLPDSVYFAPARHWSRPAMNKSLGSFLPMNTITDSFFSPLTHGLPTSPPIIMCTPWNTTRLALPFIHSTPL